jgi:hypothetical protein
MKHGILYFRGNRDGICRKPQKLNYTLPNWLNLKIKIPHTELNVETTRKGSLYSFYLVQASQTNR